MCVWQQKLQKSPGKLLKYGSELGVVYNCIQPGEVQLTLTVPLMMHEDLKWQWTKSCGGLYRPYFAVSTWNKAVARDGRAEDDWDLEFMDEPIAAAVDSSEAMTSFFITLDATDAVAEASMLQASQDEHLGTEHFMGAETQQVIEQTIPVKLAVQSYLQPHVAVSDSSILNPALGGTSTAVKRERNLRASTSTSCFTASFATFAGQVWQEKVALSLPRVGSSSWMFVITVGVLAKQLSLLAFLSKFMKTLHSPSARSAIRNQLSGALSEVANS